VVEEYVGAALPVASETLTHRADVTVSPATVRHELAVLEECGYLLQPHTSAGRVPTERGYRYYVARLMPPQRLGPGEQCALRSAVEQAWARVASSPEQLYTGAWLRTAAAGLARLVLAPAILTAPRPVGSRVKLIRLVPVQGRVLLLVAVFAGGVVEERLVRLSRPAGPRELDACARRVNRLLRRAVPELFLPPPHALQPLDADIVRSLVELLHEVQRGEPRAVYHHGAAYLLDQPEFQTSQRARPVLELLERGEVVAAPWAATRREGVTVLIGSENRSAELRDCSLLAATYSAAGGVSGTLAVLGPTRLHYAYVIAALRFTAATLSSFMAAVAGTPEWHDTPAETEEEGD
jgi:heat-inducible transcriptional repressor